MHRTSRLTMLLGIAALVSSSCASQNQVVSEWKDPAYSARGGQKVVVMAVAENEVSGRIWETEMSKQLAGHGLVVVSGSSILGTTGTRPDSAAVAAKVADAGADLVVVTRMLAVDKETTYVPGSTYVAPSAYWNGYYGLYTHAYTALETPGYIQQNTIVRLETSVFEVASGKLVWGGVSESFNPSGTESLAQNVTEKIVHRLERSGLIPAAG
jgi:microcompartment protein CcmK/EutM